MPVELHLPLRFPVLPSSISLENCAHIWQLSMSTFLPLAPTLAGLLSPEERARAASFHFARDRLRYVITRGSLRFLLGHYSGELPSSIPIRYTAHGKPFADASGMPQFSVSHSADLALLAFARCSVGVDLEHLREIPDLLAVASLAFPPAEIQALSRLKGTERERSFFTFWTRLEARLKASGQGLRSISDYSVPGRLPTVDSTPSSSKCSSNHQLKTFAVALADPYVSTLVAKSSQYLLLELIPAAR